MLTPDQQHQFDDEGFVRLPGAFSVADAAAMEASVWRLLGEKFGVDREDKSTWKLTQTSSLQEVKSEPVFAAIGSPETCSAIDGILGEGRWRRPRDWGQLLVTFPTNGQPWVVPSEMWHTDFDFVEAPDKIAGLLVVSFLAEVRPRSGGTVVIAGSHRLMQRFIPTRAPEVRAKMKLVRKAFLASQPWLLDLSAKHTNDTPEQRNQRFMTAGHCIEGIHLRVVELDGQPGDIVLGHPWLFHATAPNCGDLPRMMCVQRIRLETAEARPREW